MSLECLMNWHMSTKNERQKQAEDWDTPEMGAMV